MASLITRPAQRRRRFHALTVTHIERLTDDAVAVSFAIPDELAAEFDFEPGQHLMLRGDFDGQKVQREYSICLSRPEALARKELRVAAARVGGGLLSNWINDNLTVGDQIEVMPPLGDFTLARQSDGTGHQGTGHQSTGHDGARHHVAIVAGSGITPVMSLFPSALAEEPTSRATIIFGNRQTSSIMFRDELEELETRYPGRFQVINVLSRQAQDVELLSGRLDRQRLERILVALVPVQGVDDWYLCGPAELVEGARGLLADRGVDHGHVHSEVFDADA